MDNQELPKNEPLHRIVLNQLAYDYYMVYINQVVCMTRISNMSSPTISNKSVNFSHL